MLFILAKIPTYKIFWAKESHIAADWESLAIFTQRGSLVGGAVRRCWKGRWSPTTNWHYEEEISLRIDTQPTQGDTTLASSAPQIIL